MRVLAIGHFAMRQMMAGITEDNELIRQTLGYAIELYRELTDENGAPTLGIQTRSSTSSCAIQSCARRSRSGVGPARSTKRATTRPPRRLPYDAAYRRIRGFALSVMDKPVFARVGAGAA
jgi:hypothetical protein